MLFTKKYCILYPAFFLFTAVAFSSCVLFGIHVKVHNPRHEGKYPKFSETVQLLGKQDTRFRSCYDVTYYEIDIAVDDKKKHIGGKVVMQAVAVNDFDTLQIDLHEKLKVKNIHYATLHSLHEPEIKFIQANYRRQQGGVFIAFKQKAGEVFRISVEYEGNPPEAKKPPWRGGFVWKKDKNKNPWIGVACETEGASMWWPCKDVTNDEPDSVSVSLNVPAGLTAVSNGQFRGTEEVPGGKKYKWFVSYPINPYNVTLYIGNLKSIEDIYESPVTGKKIPVRHYVLEENLEKAKKHFLQAKKYLAFFEKIFGKYPWERDGYRLVESPYAGMEHQSAIAYGNSYKNNYNGFDYIILHESVHEWWGNAITAADLADVWLQEGFATYSEALYVEDTQGKTAYLNYMRFYRLFIKNKFPVVGPVGFRYFDYHNNDCYQKGAWVLHTLRTVIDNDEVFFSILRTFYARYKYKTTSTADFIALVNELTGEDFNWFFKQYLYERKVPMLEYYRDEENFFFRWTNVTEDFKMPAEILLDGTVKMKLAPSSAVQKILLSKEIHKEIVFNDYIALFGTKKNKRLKKISSKETGKKI